MKFNFIEPKDLKPLFGEPESTIDDGDDPDEALLESMTDEFEQDNLDDMGDV